MAIDIGTGAGITFAGFTYNLLSIGLEGIARPSIDSTHLGTTTARTFVDGDFYDAGMVRVEVQWDATIAPPISGAIADLTIDFGAVQARDWEALSTANAAGAFLTEFSCRAEGEAIMTGSGTFKVTGPWVFNAT